MNVAVTLTPVRITVNVQTRGVPTVRVTPPVQLTVRAEPRITPLTVRVGGPYVVDTAPNATAAVFVHTQSTPAAVWTIPNPFGVPCAAVNVKMEGRTVLASIYDDASVVVVDFPEPRTGFAYLIRS